MTAQVYPVGEINKVRRYNHQATYNTEFIHAVVNSTSVLHVSFVPDPNDPFPVILPMIGQMGLFPDSDDDQYACYLHGYVSSRLMRSAFEAEGSSMEGMPVCVAATKVDGLVLTLTPNSHNYNYRSAILHGYASIVEDEAEKLWAMELITNSVVPDRWKHTRVPPDGAEMQSTRILKVKITAASGKVREGVPNDETKDLSRDEVLDRVWTGVIPVYEVYGEPQSGPYNRAKQVPEHVEGFVLHANELNERYAYEAAHKPAPVKRKKAEASDDNDD